MKDLSIKVIIAGKAYSLTVKAEEEENVWKAAKLIEDRVKEFETNYGVKDKQDLLAMCALQLANEIVLNRSKKTSGEGIAEDLASIELLLDDCLEKA
jgi:cell division protein ZapA (FtsZ GTPase activity inhibitor)